MPYTAAIPAAFRPQITSITAIASIFLRPSIEIPALLGEPTSVDEDTFWRLNSEERVYELVDMVTGHILKVARDLSEPNNDATVNYVEKVMDGKVVLVHSAITDYKGSKTYSYSEALASVICQHIIDGKTITEIEAIPHMPDRTLIRKWRRAHPRFDEAFLEAERSRAEAFHDEAIQLGREGTSLTKDEVPGQKLAVETMKWAAKVGDAGKYGDKLKVEASVASEIIVSTGVPRRLSEPNAPNPSLTDTSQTLIEAEDAELVDDTSSAATDNTPIPVIPAVGGE